MGAWPGGIVTIRVIGVVGLLVGIVARSRGRAVHKIIGRQSHGSIGLVSEIRGCAKRGDFRDARRRQRMGNIAQNGRGRWGVVQTNVSGFHGIEQKVTAVVVHLVDHQFWKSAELDFKRVATPVQNKSGLLQLVLGEYA